MKHQPHLVQAPVLVVVVVVAHVANVVNLANQGLLVHQDDPERPANQEHLAFQETQEEQELSHVKQLLHHHADHAHKENQVFLVHLAQTETQDHQVCQDHQAVKQCQEHQDLKDNLDLQELQDFQEIKANQDCQPQAAEFLPAHQDQEAIKDHQDHQEWLVPQAKMELQDQWDLQDLREPQEMQDPMDNLEILVHQALQEVQERRVFARNTVPSTAVYSSKMALVAVKILDLTFLFVFHLLRNPQKKSVICEEMG